MPNHPQIIISINPGTRYLAFAIFHGYELRDAQIKAVRGKWSKEKLCKLKDILTHLIYNHQPEALILKKLHPSRSSKCLNQLVQTIQKIALIQKVPIYSYSLKEVKYSIGSGKKMNKSSLSEIITTKYPILYYELNRLKHSKNNYYIRLFEAVALGTLGIFHYEKSLSKV